VFSQKVSALQAFTAILCKSMITAHNGDMRNTPPDIPLYTCQNVNKTFGIFQKRMCGHFGTQFTLFFAYAKKHTFWYSIIYGFQGAFSTKS